MNQLQKQKMIKRLGGKCLYCYKKEGLVLDHIKPKSKGGTDSPANSQVLCVSCKSAKRNGEWDSKISIPQAMCKLCSFKWIPRRPNPVSCPRCKRYDWDGTKILLLILFVLSPMLASARTEYNPMSDHFETVSEGDKLNFNTMSGEWEYAQPDAKPRYNVMEDRYQLAAPDERLHYNPMGNTWQFSDPDSHLELNPIANSWTYVNDGGRE